MANIVYQLQKKTKGKWKDIALFSTYKKASEAFMYRDGTYKIIEVKLDDILW